MGTPDAITEHHIEDSGFPHRCSSAQRAGIDIPDNVQVSLHVSYCAASDAVRTILDQQRPTGQLTYTREPLFTLVRHISARPTDAQTTGPLVIRRACFFQKRHRPEGVSAAMGRLPHRSCLEIPDTITYCFWGVAEMLFARITAVREETMLAQRRCAGQ